MPTPLDRQRTIRESTSEIAGQLHMIGPLDGARLLTDALETAADLNGHASAYWMTLAAAIRTADAAFRAGRGTR